jgi:hypothetical protein
MEPAHAHHIVKEFWGEYEIFRIIEWDGAGDDIDQMESL